MRTDDKGVISMGIKCPLIKKGDNVVDIVVNSVLEATELDIDSMTRTYYDIKDKDVVGITESIIARAAGQYITVDDISNDIINKCGKDATISLINPIYSRNRFSLILKGIARAAKSINIVMPDYDEVGNPKGVNPFTGINIEDYYKEICETEGCECKITDTKQMPLTIINIYCGLHGHSEWKEYWDTQITHLKWGDDVKFYTLADICADVSPDWGLLGTNKANEELLKLFPSKIEAQRVCDEVKRKIRNETECNVIVCCYGDGCFKSPEGIWEFADPITMPAYTDKELIESTPNELKLKSLIDSTDDNNTIKIIEEFKKKDVKKMFNGKGAMGTTPRVYRDLLASLMDLTSGSGDRATPIVLVKNYFN